jgi:hypothetical protein
VTEYQSSEGFQIKSLIQTAHSERHKAETAFNLNSSRSNVVYRLLLRSRTKPVIAISIVDLARRTNESSWRCQNARVL